MSETPDIHGIARQLAVLEERMNSARTEYRSDLAELMRQIAEKNAETSDRIATATERMANSRWWQTAILVAVVALVGAVAGGLPALVAFLAGAAG